MRLDVRVRRKGSARVFVSLTGAEVDQLMQWVGDGTAFVLNGVTFHPDRDALVVNVDKGCEGHPGTLRRLNE